MTSLATELATRPKLATRPDLATRLATEDGRDKLKEHLKNGLNNFKTVSDKAIHNWSELASSICKGDDVCEGDDEITLMRTNIADCKSMSEAVVGTNKDMMLLLDKGKSFSKDDATEYRRLYEEYTVKWGEWYQEVGKFKAQFESFRRAQIQDRSVGDVTALSAPDDQTQDQQSPTKFADPCAQGV